MALLKLVEVFDLCWLLWKSIEDVGFNLKLLLELNVFFFNFSHSWNLFGVFRFFKGKLRLFWFSRGDLVI